MSGPDGGDNLGARLRVVQIVVAAMMAGVLTLVGIALVVVQHRNPAAGRQGPPLVTYLALVFFVAQVAVWAVLPAAMARRQVQHLTGGGRRSADSVAAYPGALVGVFVSKTIVANALLEGASFFGGIAYLVEGEPLALVVPAAGLLLMALTFPTRGRLTSWLEQQLTRIEEQRLLGDRTAL